MHFFSDMYDDIRRGDFDDSNYMIGGMILSAIISITLMVISIVVLVQPDSLQGELLKWAQSEYRFIAWIIIACILLGWALFFSYITVVENRHTDVETYGLAANILYYAHHILTGGGVIMLPIALLTTIACFIGKAIAIITTFVMKLPVYISNVKHRHATLNADIKTNLAVTFDDFNRFLR